MAVHGKLTRVVKKLMGKKKGWFVVYSMNRRRYALPLELLEKQIFVEMLKMTEDEFGLSNHQPIVFPFHSAVMDPVIEFLLSHQQGAYQDQVVMMMPIGYSS